MWTNILRRNLVRKKGEGSEDGERKRTKEGEEEERNQGRRKDLKRWMGGGISWRREETDSRVRRRRRRNRKREEEGASSGHTDTDRPGNHGASAAATEPADPAADTEPWPRKAAHPRPAPAPACCSRSARSPTCRWTR